jgi:uncharacterized protein with PIN domain
MDKFFYIRLFAGLNFFVPEKLKHRNIILPYRGKQSAKDAVESIGVPHTEFGMISLNGRMIGMDEYISENDQLIVYPHFYQLMPVETNKTTDEEETLPRFILDVHLGKLATLLRLLGFDTFYHNQLDDEEIIETACSENRIILSRDIGIFKNSRVKRGYFPRSQDSKQQLKEVIQRYGLGDKIQPFTRCLKCNGEIVPVNKSQVIGQLQENTKMYYQDFCACERCKKTYWKGSHYQKMKEFVGNISAN